MSLIVLGFRLDSSERIRSHSPSFFRSQVILFTNFCVWRMALCTWKVKSSPLWGLQWIITVDQHQNCGRCPVVDSVCNRTISNHQKPTVSQVLYRNMRLWADENHCHLLSRCTHHCHRTMKVNIRQYWLLHALLRSLVGRGSWSHLWNLPAIWGCSHSFVEKFEEKKLPNSQHIRHQLGCEVGEVFVLL